MLYQCEAVLDWMLSKAPEETWSKEMDKCAWGLRKEGQVPLWLHPSLARDLLQSLSPRFFLCNMRVEVSMISVFLSGPVFSRILVSICLILKFLDEREFSKILFKNSKNYFYSFISMIDKDKTATTKKTTILLLLFWTFYDSRMK